MSSAARPRRWDAKWWRAEHSPCPCGTRLRGSESSPDGHRANSIRLDGCSAIMSNGIGSCGTSVEPEEGAWCLEVQCMSPTCLHTDPGCIKKLGTYRMHIYVRGFGLMDLRYDIACDAELDAFEGNDTSTNGYRAVSERRSYPEGREYQRSMLTRQKTACSPIALMESVIYEPTEGTYSGYWVLGAGGGRPEAATGQYLEGQGFMWRVTGVWFALRMLWWPGGGTNDEESVDGDDEDDEGNNDEGCRRRWKSKNKKKSEEGVDAQPRRDVRQPATETARENVKGQICHSKGGTAAQKGQPRYTKGLDQINPSPTFETLAPGPQAQGPNTDMGAFEHAHLKRDMARGEHAPGFDAREGTKAKRKYIEYYTRVRTTVNRGQKSKPDA
ncbi:hypothetical protein V8D89_012109 [Ganoderma adspersum]